MKHKTVRKIVGISAALALLTTASYAESQSVSQDADSIRASKLIGAKAQTTQGEALGQIEDLIIHPQSGEIRLAIVGQSSIAELAGKMLPVPWQAIEMRSESEFHVNLEREKLKSAPTLPQDQYDQITIQDTGQEFVNQIYRFYDVEPAALTSTAKSESQTHDRQSQVQSSTDHTGQDKTGTYTGQTGTYGQQGQTGTYAGQTGTYGQQGQTGATQWDYGMDRTGRGQTGTYGGQTGTYGQQGQTGATQWDYGMDRTGRGQTGTYSGQTGTYGQQGRTVTPWDRELDTQDRYYQGQTDTWGQRRTTGQWDRDFDTRDRYRQDQTGAWGQGQAGTGRWDRDWDTRDRYDRGPTGVWGQDRSDVSRWDRDYDTRGRYDTGRTDAWGQRRTTGQWDRDLDTQGRYDQDQTGAWGQGQTGTGRWDRDFDAQDREYQGQTDRWGQRRTTGQWDRDFEARPRFGQGVAEQRAEDFHGRIQEINPRARTIRVQGQDGRSLQFRLDESAVLLARGDSGADLRDFREGQEVQVGYRRDRNGEYRALSLAESPLRAPQRW